MPGAHDDLLAVCAALVPFVRSAADDPFVLFCVVAGVRAGRFAQLKAMKAEWERGELGTPEYQRRKSAVLAEL